MIIFNGQPLDFGSYPNNETIVPGDVMARDKANCRHHDIVFSYRCDQDLMHLMFIKKHLGETPVDLTIRYMPYSRMDRAEGSSVFTLKYVCEFINALGFRKVIVEEPHSDVTCALLDRSVARYPTIELLPQVMDLIGFNPHVDYLFYPDAGAQKRYASITGFKTAVGMKHRDFMTGKLSGHMDVVGFPEAQMMATKVLILDDLVSRGGTFVMAAEELRKREGGPIYLFVTHCEDAMWSGDLLDHIDGLYCTDSMPPRDTDSRVHVYSGGQWS